MDQLSLNTIKSVEIFETKRARNYGTEKPGIIFIFN